MAVVCPSCSYQNADDARFCAGCGTPLADVAAAAPPVEERRVVSILFADLAGFTSSSDQADPEDVRRTLIPFHTIAKEEIERFGGTLDKFVGDAAMGVFGAPVAHEDDPERAVRAALAIQARTDEMTIPVRAAVNTGEAVVTFATGPQIGENVAGDVVNTASRLQGVAPHGGVVVGEGTFRATRGTVDYRELEPVKVKGKSEPLRVWVVGSVRTEIPGRADEDATPFVGREAERGLLRELFERTVLESSLQLVTVVGEPGIGKTRLVADLRERLEAGGQAVAWHRGRCLPYGESVTFAPLEEIVRDVIGVMRSDDRVAAAAKLAGYIARSEERATDNEWLRSRIAPLLGLEEPSAAAADRAESFTAWARFLASEASRSPLVLVVEDLQWADRTMLDFLDQLADHARNAPILVLGTARPELFDAHPEWGGGKTNASTITLSPMPEQEMHELLAELLVRSVLPDATQAPLVQRAGGNPLYALEFVRMLGDRAVTNDAGSIALPDSIQALIAARLDALTPSQRSLLQDAAVVGDHFWSGAVASMNAGDVPVAELHELQRRGMIRRSSTQTMEGEEELSFSHGLMRDVAYKQIPRAGRVQRHLAVARWLEETAGDRLEERAEPLAHHTSEALSLARAAHLPEDTPELRDDTRRFLLLAGKRQASLDVAQATTYYERALELTPIDHPDRSTILRDTTGFRWRSGRLGVDDAVAAYEEAADLALANDDREAAALALRRLYFQLGFRGDSDAARAALERGIHLLEDRDPTPVLAELYAALAEDEMFGGRSQESLRWATRALELPHSDFVAVMTLHIRGNGRLELGDLGGMDDLWQALHAAESSGSALDQATSYSYLSEWIGVTEGPVRGLEMNDASIEICDRRGIQGQGMWARAESLWLLYDAGRWDDLLEVVATLLPWSTEHGDTIVGSIGLSYRARVLANRGKLDGLKGSLEPVIPIARQVGDLQVQAPVFVAAAVVEHGLGNTALALDHVREFEAATRGGPTEYRELQSPEIMRICLANGEIELAARVLGDRPVHVARTQNAVITGRALLAEARGETERALAAFRDAADAWSVYGCPLERAHALVGSARCLQVVHRSEEADDDRSEAAELFRSLGVAEPT